jgi:CDGSH-type Zn-finger protein
LVDLLHNPQAVQKYGYLYQSKLTNVIQYMDSKTKIIVNSNGSLKIEGDFNIVDSEGNEYGLQGRTALGLCRCGLSANKPFCDGAHKGQFEHVSQAFDLPPKKV